MYHPKIFFTTVLCLIITLPFFSFAGIIKGTVKTNGGAILPYATIYMEGTTVGTTTNGNGDYEMSLTPGFYKVNCQIIGYKQASFNVSFTGTETITHNFVLQEQSLEMKEVTIHANAEDPAYNIIRQAIKQRSYHLDQISSFQSSIYLKAIMRSRNLPDKFMGKNIKTADLDVDSAGKGVLYLAEEYADYYTQNGKDQTIIHSVHESGSSNGIGVANIPKVVTFYENNIKLFSERGAVSPISDNAIYYYKYKYLGQFTEQGHTINKISVTPRRAFEPCFTGTLYITDNDWAIHSLDLGLVKDGGIAPLDTVKIKQIYLPTLSGAWVIQSQLLYITLKFFSFDITANASALYNNQKINEPIPDTLFHKNMVSRYDPNANKQDSAYWDKMRQLPLEKDEKKNFVVQDSLNNRVATPAYSDSVRKKENKMKPLKLMFLGQTFTSKMEKNSYTINSLFLFNNIINYNIVEGFNIAPRLTWKHNIDTGKNIFFTNAARYGFSNTHFNDMARLYYVTEDKTWKGRKWLYGLEGGKYVFQYNPDNPIFEIMNSVDALFVRENDLKIYERKEGTAFLGRDYGNGFSWFAKLSYQQRIPLQNTTDFSFDEGNDISFENNLPYHLTQMATAWEKSNAALAFIYLNWQPGYKYIQYPNYKQPMPGKLPLFSLTYEKGAPGIFGSKSNFDKYKLSATSKLPLKLLGSLEYNIGIGGFLNSNYVSIPDLMHPYGNRGIGFASPYLSSYQFMQYYDWSNKVPFYAEGHIEYKMKGLLSNKLPLLRQARFYLVFGGNAFYASNTNYYSEAFVGLDNLGWKALRLLRVDFVQSWDSNMGRNSGIRFGLSTGNGVSLSFGGPGETHSEW